MGKKTRKKKKGISLIKKIFISFFLVVLIYSGFLGYTTYKKIFQPNVSIDGKKSAYIYIPTGSGLQDVVNLLYQNNYIIDRGAFEWLAEKKNYKNHVKAGRYRVKNKMSNNELINLLRSGNQDPVNVILNNIRTKAELASQVSENLEADSNSIARLLNNNVYLAKFGLNTETVRGIFIPNTYEFFWNTSAKEFFERMYSEYDKFWKQERVEKAKQLNLSKLEVMTLASIVEEETIKRDERPKVAGVYINRLKKNMPLQADPTVRYALQDFTIKRILKKHLEIDSPYNTYKNKGLPPAPINMPSIGAIDAVLNFSNHEYLYFCAKDDFSGYHAFAKTYTEHLRNARAYQKALNKKRIWK
ncbi:MAG: endolytic transglycosylase MltG [Bacteroidota bacterium]